MSGQPGSQAVLGTGDPARRLRKRRIAMWFGGAVLLAGVVAAAFWFSSGGDGSVTVHAPRTPQARAAGQALVIGNDPAAPMTVTVYEDYLCSSCREFEQASRDYLHRDAAAGRVLVEYRPFQATEDDYSRQALTAWAAVLDHGTAAQALRLHDLLYDEQPTTPPSDAEAVTGLVAMAKRAGAGGPAVAAIGVANPGFVRATAAAARAADVRGGLAVIVDGRPLTGENALAVAQRLETMIAGS